ncbi:MAG: molybdopterin-synthase adenylyltransferase MoeB [Candidatus Sericytochromatia bacterium]|nr:molybdopterin-synthase adenylyltransferase MoeB [Candidatus Tanganyikabacteria bacterium]
MTIQTPLTQRETVRYSRHLVLPEVGPEGQARLKRAAVACVGAGGLGSPVALYLAAAGVGRIGLIDHDAVEEHNLQRQVLFRQGDVGSSKLAAARRELLGLNPDIEVDVHEVRLAAGNALDVLGGYDIVVDGADNFPTRYLVNDACVLLGKPEVWASIFRWEGQVAVFDARRGPCYRCLFPRMPEAGSVPNCAEGGVLGVLPGVMGTLQANEVIKLILGRGDALLGRLLLFDALGARFEELQIGKDPACPACGPGAKLELRDEAEVCEVPDDDALNVSADWLKARMDAGTAPPILDCRQPFEWDICQLPGSMLVPMAEIPRRLDEFARDAEIVVVCHHGRRSLNVAQFMRQRGFARARSLDGGLDEWARRIDPAMARY